MLEQVLKMTSFNSWTSQNLMNVLLSTICKFLFRNSWYCAPNQMAVMWLTHCQYYCCMSGHIESYDSL